MRLEDRIKGFIRVNRATKIADSCTLNEEVFGNIDIKIPCTLPLIEGEDIDYAYKILGESIMVALNEHIQNTKGK